MKTYVVYFILFTLILFIFLIIKYTTSNVELFNELYDIPFNIKRKKNDTATVISGVPLVIYQSWHTNKIPYHMKETIYKLLDMNPEFDYYLYSDEKSREFISANYSQEVLSAFDTLKPGAYKSDLWRYCILYKTGGVYLDIKYFSVSPLLDIVRVTPIVYVKENDISCEGTYNKIYNGFMVSPPNNVIFKMCIDEIVNNCKLKLYKGGPLHVTGPCLFGKLVYEHNGNEYVNVINIQLDIVSDDIFRIVHNNVEFLKSYKEYRYEQKKYQKLERYTKMWNDKNIYY